jgi:hypothetical protein
MNIFGENIPRNLKDLLTQRFFITQNGMKIKIAPYEILWLKPHFQFFVSSQ